MQVRNDCEALSLKRNARVFTTAVETEVLAGRYRTVTALHSRHELDQHLCNPGADQVTIRNQRVLVVECVI